jgi:WD40 repeat protein
MLENLCSAAPASFQGQENGNGETFCEGLELEHVYGYRGTDCRSNVFHMRTGEAVYHAGSFGIVHNIVYGPNTMHRQIWFKDRHKGQITCATLHPDGTTVATAECASKIDEVPLIFLWRLVNGDCNLVGTCNDPLNKKVGLLEDVISCLAFSKGGRYLVAIGGRWPNQSLVVYEWDTDDCGAIVKQDLGREKVLSVGVNPYTDTIVVTGDRFINLMHSARSRKEAYRQVAGHLRWDLTYEDVLYQGAQAAANDASAGKDRGQILFQHDMASGKARKGDKRDIFGTIPEQDEAGRDVHTLSESGFNRLRSLITEHATLARDAIDSKCPVSAIAECKCGLRATEKLMDTVDKGLVRDFGAAVVDSIEPRQALARLQNHLKALLLEAMDAMNDHQATYSRTYDMDSLLQEKFAYMRRTFAHLLDGSRPHLQESLRRAEAELNELVNIDVRRQLCVESCHVQTRLGAGYWKINQDSPVMHTPRLQAVFCLGFTGLYTFITGTEDGSLYFWDGSELVGAVPVHEDAIIDMAVDLNGFESKGSFHVVTAGYDGTVRLSRCQRFEQGLRNQFYSGIVLQQLQTVVLPLSISTRQPSPAVSISNIIGIDKFSGLPCVDWVDKPAGYARFTMSKGVEFSAESIATSKQSFLIGTADNCLFHVCFEDRESQATSSGPDPACFPVVQAHAGRGVNCVCAHPKQSNLIFSGGEDGVARMWDVPRRELKKWYFAKDAITCADFSGFGHIIAVGFRKGGFMIFDSVTLLPKSQVVREFEVLIIKSGNQFTCTTTSGPINDSEKVMKKKLERLRERRDYIVKKSKGEQNIPADVLPEFGSWVAEIKVIEQRLFLKQQKLFKGSFLVFDDVTVLTRRRTLLQDLNLTMLSGINLTKGQQEVLIQETIKERQQEHLLISDIDYQILNGTVTIKFSSALSRQPQNRATIQNIQDIVRHLKRSTFVVKFSPDNKYLAVAGLDNLVYVHQVLQQLEFDQFHQHFTAFTIFITLHGIIALIN